MNTDASIESYHVESAVNPGNYTFFNHCPTEAEIRLARANARTIADYNYSITIKHSCGHRIVYYVNEWREIGITVATQERSACPYCGGVFITMNQDK